MNLWSFKRVLPDGRALTLMQLTYGRARLVIGPDGSPWYDDGW